MSQKVNADACERDGARVRARIFFKRAHHTEQEHRHCGGEGRVLGVYEHVAVVERAGREQYERDQTGRGSAEATANSPGRNQSDDANRSPDQSPGLEKTEGEHFGGERSRHVKAAAIFVEIDEGQRALIAKTRTVEREQQIAILRMGVVVPSEAVVAER